MKLIKPSAEILFQELDKPLLNGSLQEQLTTKIYQEIEVAGRTCYKSENNITRDSAKKFVDMLINRGHGAMLEHGTVYLQFEAHNNVDFPKRYYNNQYSKCVGIGGYIFITTNYRVLLENNWLDDLQYICLPTEHHEKRVSVRFICDRGVSHEFVRNRGRKINIFTTAEDDELSITDVYAVGNGIAQESTRYCNYSKDKFGEEVTCILPPGINLPENSYKFTASCDDKYGYIRNSNGDFIGTEGSFLFPLMVSEEAYFTQLKEGKQPQQARNVLPIALKTEVIMTCFTSDWEHFFNLRCAENAHPQARELAIPLHEEFTELRYID